MSARAAEAMADMMLADAIARGKLPAEAAVLLPSEPVLHHVEVSVCQMCLDGVGGECHTPGCVFWMNDAPNESQATALRPHIVDSTEEGEAHNQLDGGS